MHVLENLESLRKNPIQPRRMKASWGKNLNICYWSTLQKSYECASSKKFCLVSCSVRHLRNRRKRTVNTMELSLPGTVSYFWLQLSLSLSFPCYSSSSYQRGWLHWLDISHVVLHPEALECSLFQSKNLQLLPFNFLRLFYLPQRIIRKVTYVFSLTLNFV